MHFSYRHTMIAAYIGYITQAIINNFAPLLFLTFSSTWGIPLPRMALLILINFGIQLVVDLLSARYIDRIGYRPCIIAAHVFAALGLVGLGVFPHFFASPYAGILLAAVLYAVGGGLIEVLISPIVESCPTTHKESEMSLLHSFYCWGSVLTIALSTAFFACFGVNRWPVLACLWALIPLLNALYFRFVPLRQLNEDPEAASVPLFRLAKMPLLWLFILLMFCSGASEQAMSQWASGFAEAGLGVSKTLGDLAGPCMFSVLMGLARLLSSRLTLRMPIEKIIFSCGLLCIASYLLASLSPVSALSLLGCALCGLSVGVMWPGTFSMASFSLRGGGTALFALLALAGDLGCMGGPAVIGAASSLLGGSLKQAMLLGVIFPVLLITGLMLYKKREQ